MEKIDKYIEELFETAPKNKNVKELKEELKADLKEKYNDLIKEGQDEKKAFQEVISGIGDIDELINSLKITDKLYISSKEIEHENKVTALIVSISVGLYILSLISVIILDELGMPDAIVASSLFGIAGIASCLLVYRFVSKPKYQKQGETLVEDFKEYRNGRNKNREIKRAMSSILWVGIIIVYFLTSFFTNAWYITWVLFLVGVLLESILVLIFKLKE